MGWASAGNIFDPVAQALIDAKLPGEKVRIVLVKLIKQLEEGDWDTQDESLGIFLDNPVVVDAFRECGHLPPGEDGLAEWLYEYTHAGLDESKRIAVEVYPQVMAFVENALHPSPGV